MKHRKLRIAWSVAWGAVAIVLCVLWVWSYGKVFHHTQFAIPTHRYEISSRAGRLVIIQRTRVFISLEAMLAYPETMFSDLTERTTFGIGRYSSGYFSGVSIGHWLLAAAAVVVSVLVWVPFRFSLRTLLIVTTLFAAGLGLIVWVR